MSLFNDSLKVYFTFVNIYYINSFVSFILDYNHIYEKYKIVKRSPSTYLQLYSYCFKKVFMNVCIYSYPYILGGLYINRIINGESIHYYDNSVLKNIGLLLYFWCITYYVIFDTLFYTFHRLSHNSKLLYTYHKVHHEILNPVSISTFYMHPIDFYLGNITPLLASLILLNYNIYTLQLIIIISISFSTSISHGGYTFSSKHNIHHSKFKYNYGISNFIINMDKLFNTLKK